MTNNEDIKIDITKIEIKGIEELTSSIWTMDGTLKNLSFNQVLSASERIATGVANISGIWNNAESILERHGKIKNKKSLSEDRKCKSCKNCDKVCGGKQNTNSSPNNVVGELSAFNSRSAVVQTEIINQASTTTLDTLSPPSQESLKPPDQEILHPSTVESDNVETRTTELSDESSEKSGRLGGIHERKKAKKEKRKSERRENRRNNSYGRRGNNSYENKLNSAVENINAQSPINISEVHNDDSGAQQSIRDAIPQPEAIDNNNQSTKKRKSGTKEKAMSLIGNFNTINTGGMISGALVAGTVELFSKLSGVSSDQMNLVVSTLLPQLLTVGPALLPLIGAIAPVVLGFLALAWPILAIIAGIVLLVGIFNWATGGTVSAMGVLFGVFGLIGATIYNFFAAMINLHLGFIEFIGNLIYRDLGGVFSSLGESVVNLLNSFKGITMMVDKWLGTDLTGAVDNAIAKVETMTSKDEEKSVDLKRLEYKDTTKVWDSSYSAGEKLGNKASNMTSGAVGNIKGMFGGDGGGGVASTPIADVVSMNSAVQNQDYGVSPTVQSATEDSQVTLSPESVKSLTAGRTETNDNKNITNNNHVVVNVTKDTNFETFKQMLKETLGVTDKITPNYHTTYNA